jgi:D-threonate/D-erythronate kinase
MLAVLADDFTGAAEVAAIGHRYGLVAEVHTTFQPGSTGDLVVVDTHTRSSTRAAAGRRVAEEVARLRDAGLECIYYKKVDSVLRGHVVEELSRLLDVWGLSRALLVPFNPSLGQRISDGRYSIKGTPLHQTGFALDPEYPALTADVLELLGPRDGVEVSYSENAEHLAESGIVVTGGVGRDDLLALADRLDGRTLAAGAAEFFDAILQRRFGVHGRRAVGARAGAADKTLLILGSRAATSRETVTAARGKGLPVLPMPRELYDGLDPEVMDRWTASVVHALVGSDVVVIAVGEADGVTAVPAMLAVDLLPTRLAELSAATLARWSGGLRFVVSGGTTASAIVRRLGWDLLRVTSELAPGVVALDVPGFADLSITVKPGSYGWPDTLARALSREGAA